MQDRDKAENFAKAKLASLMPLRKPLAKWAIHFTFSVAVVVLALDAMGRTPSKEVLDFLSHIIDGVTLPIIGYIGTSTIETIAKMIKGQDKEGEHERQVFDTDRADHHPVHDLARRK